MTETRNSNPLPEPVHGDKRDLVGAVPLRAEVKLTERLEQWLVPYLVAPTSAGKR